MYRHIPSKVPSERLSSSSDPTPPFGFANVDGETSLGQMVSQPAAHSARSTGGHAGPRCHRVRQRRRKMSRGLLLHTWLLRLLFAMAGVAEMSRMPLGVLHYSGRHLTSAELVTGEMFIVFLPALAAPVWAVLSDKLFLRKKLLILSQAIALVSILLLALPIVSASPSLVLSLVLVFSACSPLGLLEAHALDVLGSAHSGVLGSIRVWSPLARVLGLLLNLRPLVMLADYSGAVSVLLVYAGATLLVMVAMGVILPERTKYERKAAAAEAATCTSASAARAGAVGGVGVRIRGRGGGERYLQQLDHYDDDVSSASPAAADGGEIDEEAGVDTAAELGNAFDADDNDNDDEFEDEDEDDDGYDDDSSATFEDDAPDAGYDMPPTGSPSQSPSLTSANALAASMAAHSHSAHGHPGSRRGNSGGGPSPSSSPPPIPLALPPNTSASTLGVVGRHVTFPAPLMPPTSAPSLWASLTAAARSCEFVYLMVLVMAVFVNAGVCDGARTPFLFPAERKVRNWPVLAAAGSEAVALLAARPLLDMCGHHTMLMVALLASVARPFSYAALSLPTLTLAPAIEVMRGAAVGLLWIVAVQYVARAFSRRWRATGQALLAVVMVPLGEGAGDVFAVYAAEKVKPVNIFRLAGLIGTAVVVAHTCLCSESFCSQLTSSPDSTDDGDDVGARGRGRGGGRGTGRRNGHSDRGISLSRGSPFIAARGNGAGIHPSRHAARASSTVAVAAAAAAAGKGRDSGDVELPALPLRTVPSDVVAVGQEQSQYQHQRGHYAQYHSQRYGSDGAPTTGVASQRSSANPVAAAATATADVAHHSHGGPSISLTYSSPSSSTAPGLSTSSVSTPHVGVPSTGVSVSAGGVAAASARAAVGGGGFVRGHARSGSSGSLSRTSTSTVSSVNTSVIATGTGAGKTIAGVPVADDGRGVLVSTRGSYVSGYDLPPPPSDGSDRTDTTAATVATVGNGGARRASNHGRGRSFDGDGDNANDRIAGQMDAGDASFARSAYEGM